jgi:arginyl-tRNA synthetase
MGFWDRDKKKIVNEEVEAEEVEEEEDDEVDCYIHIFCDGDKDTNEALTWNFDSIKERDRIYKQIVETLKDIELRKSYIEYQGDLVFVSKIKYILARDD